MRDRLRHEAEVEHLPTADLPQRAELLELAEADAIADMSCLPPALKGRKYYEPGGRGFEAELKRRLEEWEKIRRERRG